nr:u11/u12 small nuclear ribonucleoprotein 25 kda protein [Quercus suber]
MHESVCEEVQSGTYGPWTVVSRRKNGTKLQGSGRAYNGLDNGRLKHELRKNVNEARFSNVVGKFKASDGSAREFKRKLFSSKPATEAHLADVELKARSCGGEECEGGSSKFRGSSKLDGGADGHMLCSKAFGESARELVGIGSTDCDVVPRGGANHEAVETECMELEEEDVFVAKNATVAELKQAIEEVFASAADEISWCHVWGHFCLCYNGQKLINDKTCLQNFGIKDGDQLQFIRHMSVQYSPLRKKPSNKSVAYKQQSLEMELVDFDVRSSSGSDSHEEISSDDSYNNENQDSSKDYSDENQEEVPLLEFKLAKFLRRWLSNSRSRSLLKNGSEGRSAGTGFPLHCLGGVPRFNAKDKLM